MSQAHTEQTVALYDRLIKSITNKWIFYHGQMFFKDSESLFTIISTFINPIYSYVKNENPEIFKDGNTLFLTLVYKGIVEAKTHNEIEVKNAFIQISSDTNNTKSLAKKLNHPVKRLGFAFFIAGILIASFGFIMIWLDTHDIERAWYYYINAVIQDRWHYREYKLAAAGTYLAVISFFFAFMYDSTIGRLINWIKHGHT